MVPLTEHYVAVIFISVCSKLRTRRPKSGNKVVLADPQLMGIVNIPPNHGVYVTGQYCWRVELKRTVRSKTDYWLGRTRVLGIEEYLIELIMTFRTFLRSKELTEEIPQTRRVCYRS